MSGEAKIKGIKEFLDNIFLSLQDQKFIIFAHHYIVLDALEPYLQQKLGKDLLVRIDGNTDPKYR